VVHVDIVSCTRRTFRNVSGFFRISWKKPPKLHLLRAKVVTVSSARMQLMAMKMLYSAGNVQDSSCWSGPQKKKRLKKKYQRSGYPAIKNSEQCWQHYVPE
jgi:hypothetical protein